MKNFSQDGRPQGDTENFNRDDSRGSSENDLSQFKRDKRARTRQVQVQKVERTPSRPQSDRPDFNSERPQNERQRPDRDFNNDKAYNRSYDESSRGSYGNRQGGDSQQRSSYNPNFTRDNRLRDNSKPSDRDFNRTSSSYGDKPAYGDKPRYNSSDRPSGDRPAYGDKPRFGGGDKPSYGDKPRYNSSDRPSYGDKPRYNSSDRPSGDRPAYGDKPRFGGGDKPSYGDKPRYNSSDRPSYGDKPRYNSSDRPSGDRPAYGDKPRFGGNRQGGDSRSRGNDRPSNGSFTPRPKHDPNNYPQFPAPKFDDEVRLNRYIATSGLCSRREADEFITQGSITINDVVITELGSKVKPNDVVKHNGEVIQSEKKVYIVMNKPRGYVTTIEDDHADKTVMDLLRDACKERVYPVGRLDKNSVGVLLFTNDGDLTTKLTHPAYNKKKIYQVALDKLVTRADMERMAAGIELEDGEIYVDEIAYVGESKKEVGVEIHSGRNRIVRRIFEHCGYKVTKLDRVYFAGLTKKALTRGAWRFLTPREVSMLKSGEYE